METKRKGNIVGLSRSTWRLSPVFHFSRMSQALASQSRSCSFVPDRETIFHREIQCLCGSSYLYAYCLVTEKVFVAPPAANGRLKTVSCPAERPTVASVPESSLKTYVPAIEVEKCNGVP